MFKITQCALKCFFKQNIKTACRNLSSINMQNNLNGSKTLHLITIKSSEFKFPVLNRIPLRKIEELPLEPNKIIENPRDSLLNEINDIIRKQQINEIIIPTNSQKIEKQAARLVVIRKRKMKKHKLKKLRKKMKFEWAKVRQRREMRKEKTFQAELIAQIKEAEKFSAEEYVADKLRQANETPIPRFWKGKRLPQFIIKQKLGIK